MKKKFVSPITASDYAVSLYVNDKTPKILEFQLFWFEDIITEFLSQCPRDMWIASNGIRVGLADDFTYTPCGMETLLEGYLTGFASNTQVNCYNKCTISYETVEEKDRLKAHIIKAVHELVDAAVTPQRTCSPRLSWIL